MRKGVNLAVIGVLGIFAFVYSTVLSCVVRFSQPRLCSRVTYCSGCVSRSTQGMCGPQIIPWLSFSVPGVMHLATFSANTGLALVCFLFCVVMDPGRCASSIYLLDSLVCRGQPSLASNAACSAWL